MARNIWKQDNKSKKWTSKTARAVCECVATSAKHFIEHLMGVVIADTCSQHNVSLAVMSTSPWTWRSHAVVRTLGHGARRWCWERLAGFAHPFPHRHSKDDEVLSCFAFLSLWSILITYRNYVYVYKLIFALASFTCKYSLNEHKKKSIKSSDNLI